MRRNAVAILKYLVFAAFFLTLGPITVKLIFSDKNDNVIEVHAAADGPHGLPVDPEDLGRFMKATSYQVKWISRRIDANDPSKQNDDHPQLITNALGKIDWHDYSAISQELLRTGPGEQGAAVALSTEDVWKKDGLYKVNGFNAFASDKISLNRSLKDIRHPECKHQKYLAKLPNVSVVIPFHNEHWTTLMRSVTSVINRSPKQLMHEVILVDDFSTKVFLKKTLDDYLATHFEGKVKVVHQDRREGLIRTRISGAKAASGEVLIFLDSHVEANVNWLPPLLEPIAEDYRTVVCPFIDVIDFENFAYRAQDEGARGAFDWEFFYKRLPLLPEDLKHPAQPFKSPVMAGGLFAISSKWFWELGGYDPGLDIWGGEQYELSFKLWQCGGQMVDAPCSRVGHIYRKFAPFPNPGVGDFVGRNYRRVAEVWMDEYKNYIYERRPHYKNINPGDLKAQFAIREKLKCKPFKWFMQEIAFDLPKRYPMVEPPNVAEGELRSLGTNFCVDTKYRGENDRFGLALCLKNDPNQGGEQQMELTWHKDIRPRRRSVCFDVSESTHKAPIIVYNCHGMQGNQWWKFNVDTKQLFHPISAQCLDCDLERKEIFMTHCDISSPTQKWQWESLNVTLAQKEWALTKEELDRL